MDAIDKRARGEAAKQLLENEMLADGLRRIEEGALDALASVPLENLVALQACVARYQAVSVFRADLQSFITTGNLAKREVLTVA